MPLYTDAKRACEDEDRELRRQAILGTAHYRSARAFAVNPARLKARPLRAAGIDRSARPSKGASMPRNGRKRLADQPEDSISG